MAASEKSEVLVIGSSNTDFVVHTARLPKPGETLLGGSFFTAAGGKGANQAVAAARAGARVTFVCRTGSDDLGKQAQEGLRREDIDTSYMLADPDNPSGVAFILVGAQGENSIVVAPGANATLSPAQLDAAGPAFDRAAICLLQLEIPLATVAHAVGMAAQRGVPVILNPAPACDLPPDILSGVSLLTPNASETETMTGIFPRTEADACRAAEALRRQGVESVLITMGAQGAMLATRSSTVQVPAPKVQPVDTTAAGDAFNGALACALSSGTPLREAVRFANCAGALAVTRRGAQPSLPVRGEIERLLSCA